MKRRVGIRGRKKPGKAVLNRSLVFSILMKLL